tara:strand:- start:234 stop:560 length:327 start_codon:yes stop_codon:yes gene_type:complete
MSRCYLKSKDNKTVVVGIDPGLECWFAQVYLEASLFINEEYEEEIGEDEIILEYPVCSRNKLLEVIEKYTDTEDPYTKQAIHYIILDYDPGLIDPNKYKEEKKDDATS